MKQDNINTVLSNTHFPKAKSGGCVSFAVALDKVFDAEEFPCAFDPFDDQKPLHATAVIDNIVYDADGSHGNDYTYVQDWWSGLRKRDFHNAHNRKEENFKLDEYLKQHGYKIYKKREHLYNIGANEHRVEQYVEIIKSNIKK